MRSVFKREAAFEKFLLRPPRRFSNILVRLLFVIVFLFLLMKGVQL